MPRKIHRAIVANTEGAHPIDAAGFFEGSSTHATATRHVSLGKMVRSFLDPMSVEFLVSAWLRVYSPPKTDMLFGGDVKGTSILTLRFCIHLFANLAQCLDEQLLPR